MALAIFNYRWLRPLVMLLLITTMTACGGNSKSAIVGKWRLIGISSDGVSNPINPQMGIDAQLQFYEKDTVIVSVNFSSGGQSQVFTDNGNYQFVDDKNIRIDVPLGSQGLGALKMMAATFAKGKVQPVFSSNDPTPVSSNQNRAFDTNPNGAVYEVEMSGNTMKLKSADGIILTYKK